MAKQVKDVYGNALFEVACEEDKIDAYLAEAQAVQTALTENPELVQMMTHPQISEEEKEEVLAKVFQGRVSEELYGLLAMVLAKGHFADTTAIFDHFIAKVKAYRHIGVVYVTTPLALSDAQKKAVEEKLLATTDFVELETHYSEDTGLIGGMVIRIGDRVVDSSIRTKLERLSHELAAGR